jgi:hypothetical protein
MKGIAMPSATAAKPVRVGVVPTIDEADRLVQQLLDAGFPREKVTVICSDRAIAEHFREFHHLQPPGAKAPKAVLWGGEVGAALGSVATIAGLAAGGLEYLTVAPVIIPAGAVFGGMVGAMIEEGTESELAEYYDQAVLDGRILVAVEDRSDQAERMLTTAERIITEAGARPVALQQA